MKKRPSSPQTLLLLAILALIIFVGFALRVYRIGAVAYRGDEAFTVLNWMLRPLSESLTTVITSDPQPPLAYASFRAWGVILGTHEVTTRLLPALMNLLGISALYVLGTRIGGRSAGILAALLWAVHPYHIWHSQDARNYAIWGALSAVSLVLALRALDHRRRRDWALYIVAATSTAYFYYLELFTLVVLNGFVLLTQWRGLLHPRRFGVIWQWSGAQICIGALLAVWFLQPQLLSGGGYGGTTGGFDAAQLLTRFISALSFGETLSIQVSDGLWIVLLAILSFGALALWHQQRKIAPLLGLLGTVPLVLLALISLRLNVFTPRYVLAAAPAYVLLFVALIMYLRTRKTLIVRTVMPLLLFGGWLLLDGYSLYSYWSGTPKAPDWRSLAAYLDQNVRDEDVVVLTSSDISFTLYYADAFEYLPANQNQTPEEITVRLEILEATYQSIWIIGQTHPDWRGAGVIESWTGEQMQVGRNIAFDGVTVVQLLPYWVDIQAIPTEAQARFGEVAELVGARVFIEPDDTVRIWLYWRPVTRTVQPLKVFVHLLGEVNPATGSLLWSQDDQFPQDGRVDTTNWEVGTIVRDVYIISLTDVPIGTYQLAVGLYEPETNTRVATETGDSFILPMPIQVP